VRDKKKKESSYQFTSESYSRQMSRLIASYILVPYNICTEIWLDIKMREGEEMKKWNWTKECYRARVG